MREAEHVWGQGSMWEISVTSPQFCCEPTASLKKLSLKLQKEEQTKPTSSLRKEIIKIRAKINEKKN